MRGCAGQRHVQPESALDAGHHADRRSRGFQDRALLDVRLEHGADGPRAGWPRTPVTDALELGTERGATGIRAAIGEIQRVHPGEDTGTQHGGRKPGTFLVGPVHHLHGPACRDAVIVQRSHHLEAREHSVYTIELATRGLGVQVTGQEYRVRIALGACTDSEQVARLVDRHLAVRLGGPAHEQVPARPVLLGQGLPIATTTRGRTHLGHVHQGIPQTICIDRRVVRCCGHGWPG